MELQAFIEELKAEEQDIDEHRARLIRDSGETEYAKRAYATSLALYAVRRCAERALIKATIDATGGPPTK